MPAIATMNPPRTVEELRSAILLLLEDHFAYHASIVPRDNYIEFNREDCSDLGTDALVLVVDADRHPLAFKGFRKWRDDAPPDEIEAEDKASAEPQLRADALLANALNAEEQHFLRMVRTLLDSGYTSSQLVRRLMHHTGEGDPAEWPPLNGHVEGDRLPGLLRKTRSAIAKLFESDFDRRVQRVECSGYANGGCTFTVSFKGVKSQPDQIQIQVGPVR